MIAWDAELQGRDIVVTLEYNGRQISAPIDRDDLDEMVQRFTELIIESELDEIEDESDDEWLDDEEDCA